MVKKDPKDKKIIAVKNKRLRADDDATEDPSAKKAKVEVAEAKGTEKPEKKKSGVMYDINCAYADLLQTNAKKPKERQRLVEKIIGLMKNSKMTALQMGSSPHGSHAIQACLKRGTKEQRDELLEYCREFIGDLILNQAGGMVVEKLLRYVPKVGIDEDEVDESKSFEERKSIANKKVFSKEELAAQEKMIDEVIGAFLGMGENAFHKVFFHKHGCRSLNQLCANSFMKQPKVNKLLNLVQIPKKISLMFAQYDPSKDIKRNLLLNPQFVEKKENVDMIESTLVPHLQEVVEKCIDKELLDLSITHSMISFFALAASTEPKLEDAKGRGKGGKGTQGKGAKNADGRVVTLVEKTDSAVLRNFVEQRLVVDALPHLMQTKAGVEATIRFLGYFTAKQKKAIVKLFKGKVKEMATNSVCYMLLVRLLQVVDDTVMLQKQILNELIDGEKIDQEVWNNQYGKRVLFACLVSPQDRYWNAYELEVCGSVPAPTALKDASKRREEFQKFMHKHLVNTIEKGNGWFEALTSLENKDFALWYLNNKTPLVGLDEAKAKALSAEKLGETIVKEMKGSKSEKELTETLLNTPFMDKKLSLAIKFNSAFAGEFWTNVLKARVVELIGTSRAWLIVHCYNSSDKKEDVLKTLTGKKAEIVKKIKEVRVANGDVRGAEALFSDMKLDWIK